jgi:hypothetical protein|tara:strand:- start:1494 stop:2015 length:522 start_codon:yes stop_codon:yes gene_type:complete
MKFKLDKKQLNYALGLAMKRHDAKHSSFRNKDTTRFMNDSKGQMSEKFSVDKQYMAHFLGVIGELGYSLATGETIDENIYSVRDDGQDFEGVEVKTITYMGSGEPELKITVKEYEQRKPPKLYVLTRFNLKNNEVEVLGRITRPQFDKVKIKKRYGARLPMNYIIPLSKMEKM